MPPYPKVCYSHVCVPFFLVEAIEVMDTIAVSAFGKPLPLIKPRYTLCNNTNDDIVEYNTLNASCMHSY